MSLCVCMCVYMKENLCVVCACIRYRIHECVCICVHVYECGCVRERMSVFVCECVWELSIPTCALSSNLSQITEI